MNKYPQSPFHPIESWADQVEKDDSRKKKLTEIKKRKKLDKLTSRPNNETNNNNFPQKNKYKPTKKSKLISQQNNETVNNSPTNINDNSKIKLKSTPPSSNKNRKNKKKEEGKKLFVGGISFEKPGYTLEESNELLSVSRAIAFSRIFYNFGVVKRVQGHWKNGYCFVIFSKRKYAKTAIKYLSIYEIRKKIVRNLRDHSETVQGVMPLPSFYVRWPNDNKQEASPPLPNIEENREKDEMDEETIEQLLKEIKISYEKEEESEKNRLLENERKERDEMDVEIENDGLKIGCRNM